MIPKTLHQIWLNSELPQRVQDSIASWQQHAPQFVHRLWRRDELVAQFGAAEGSPAVQSNFYRVMLLGAVGGVYVDADAFAQPGAGESLAAICEGADLLAATVAGQQSYDNTPMGCVADYPGWYELAQDSALLMKWWNIFLANQTTFAALPGWAWNAPRPGPRVMVVHNRRTLSPVKPFTPGVRIVLDTPAKKEVWKRGLILQEESDLQIVAMRKSGHHAVLRWLAAESGREVHHFNDCTAVDGCFRYTNGQVYAGKKPVQRVCNFEDFDLQPALIAKQKVLVIRSPLNCFASRIEGMARVPGMLPELRAKWLDRDLWKAHAREFLSETNHLGDCLKINFDRWHQTTSSNRSEVEKPGESMFDGVKLDGRGEEMDVLNRWQQLKDHPDMQRIMADDELRELWQRIEAM